MKPLYSLSTTDENAFNRLARASAGLGPFTMTVSAPPLPNVGLARAGTTGGAGLPGNPSQLRVEETTAPPLVGRDAPGVPGGMFGTTIRPPSPQEIAGEVEP